MFCKRSGLAPLPANNATAPRSLCWRLAALAASGLRAEYPAGLRETALDLPVSQPAEHDEWFAADYRADQPIYTAGIAVNPALQPINQHGAVIAANVRVAGAALAGADLIRQRCVEGVALATGWRAGA